MTLGNIQANLQAGAGPVICCTRGPVYITPQGTETRDREQAASLTDRDDVAQVVSHILKGSKVTKAMEDAALIQLKDQLVSAILSDQTDSVDGAGGPPQKPLFGKPAKKEIPALAAKLMKQRPMPYSRKL